MDKKRSIIVTLQGKYSKVYDIHHGTRWEINDGCLTVFDEDKLVKSYAKNKWIEVNWN